METPHTFRRFTTLIICVLACALACVIAAASAIVVSTGVPASLPATQINPGATWGTEVLLPASTWTLTPRYALALLSIVVLGAVTGCVLLSRVMLPRVMLTRVTLSQVRPAPVMLARGRLAQVVRLCVWVQLGAGSLLIVGLAAAELNTLVGASLSEAANSAAAGETGAHAVSIASPVETTAPLTGSVVPMLLALGVACCVLPAGLLWGGAVKLVFATPTSQVASALPWAPSGQQSPQPHAEGRRCFASHGFTDRVNAGHSFMGPVELVAVSAVPVSLFPLAGTIQGIHSAVSTGSPPFDLRSTWLPVLLVDCSWPVAVWLILGGLLVLRAVRRVLVGCGVRRQLWVAGGAAVVAGSVLGARSVRWALGMPEGLPPDWLTQEWHTPERQTPTAVLPAVDSWSHTLRAIAELGAIPAAVVVCGVIFLLAVWRLSAYLSARRDRSAWAITQAGVLVWGAAATWAFVWYRLFIPLQVDGSVVSYHLVADDALLLPLATMLNQSGNFTWVLSWWTLRTQALCSMGAWACLWVVLSLTGSHRRTATQVLWGLGAVSALWCIANSGAVELQPALEAHRYLDDAYVAVWPGTTSVIVASRSFNIAYAAATIIFSFLMLDGLRQRLFPSSPTEAAASDAIPAKAITADNIPANTVAAQPALAAVWWLLALALPCAAGAGGSFPWALLGCAFIASVVFLATPPLVRRLVASR